MGAGSEVHAETDGRGVAVLTIDRPGAANSLAPAARDALAAAFESAARDRAVRAVLLRATGDRHFCTGAGLDPDAPQPVEKRAGDVAAMLQHGWQRLVRSVLDCPKPVVCAVNGAAAGAGGSLVLASDLVVMAETASYVPVFVRRGIVPDAGATHLLVRVTGLRRASEILMLGDAVPADACLRLGIANRVVAPAELAARADELVARLAAGPTTSLGLTKRLLLTSTESGRDQAFGDESWAQEIASGTRDLQEGLAAFAERRAPRFEGR